MLELRTIIVCHTYVQFFRVHDRLMSVNEQELISVEDRLDLIVFQNYVSYSNLGARAHTFTITYSLITGVNHNSIKLANR